MQNKMNVQLKKNIRKLRKSKTGLWKTAATLLAKSKRQRVSMSVDRLLRLASDGEKIVVPGKLIGISTKKKKVEVYAYSVTPNALKAIENGGGKLHLISSLSEKDISGAKGYRIMK